MITILLPEKTKEKLKMAATETVEKSKVRISKTLPPRQRVQVLPAYDIEDDLQVLHSGVTDEDGIPHFDECPTIGGQQMIQTPPGGFKRNNKSAVKLLDCHGNTLDPESGKIIEFAPTPEDVIGKSMEGTNNPLSRL